MRALPLVALVLVLAACSQPQEQAPAAAAAKPAAAPPPSAAEARDLIAASAELGEFEFTRAGLSIPVAPPRSEPVEKNARELAEAGWISVDSAGRVGLNGKSREDKRFLLRENGILDIVPLARKEMGDVSAVAPNEDGTATATFTWRWQPNEVGAALRSGPPAEAFTGEQTSRATFIWDGTSWSILRIDR